MCEFPSVYARIKECVSVQGYSLGGHVLNRDVLAGSGGVFPFREVLECAKPEEGGATGPGEKNIALRVVPESGGKSACLFMLLSTDCCCG